MMNEIKDDEIRIISATPATPARRRRFWLWLVIASAAVVFAILACLILCDTDEANESSSAQYTNTNIINQSDITLLTNKIAPAAISNAYTEIKDTVIAGEPIIIYTPVDAHAKLHIGMDVLADSSVVFAVQAADIRRDNGGIAGAFIINGELLSRGKTKAGYCAIINDVISIGVADATPLLEEALDNNGYFFRQYPLVVSGHALENKPRNRSLRKALAQYNGGICVIASKNKLTLNDFAALLADMGVENAIYLVGSQSVGTVRDKDGNVSYIGKSGSNPSANTNFIVWQ